MLKGFTHHEAKEGKYLDQFISTNTISFQAIDTILAERFHINEAKEGKYLDQFISTNTQHLNKSNKHQYTNEIMYY